MLSDSNKYNKEIDLIRSAAAGEVLHPLRKQQIKQDLLAQISIEDRIPSALAKKLSKRSNLVKYIVTTLAGILLVAGSAFASNSARPGDALFPVKKLKENIQLGLTTNPKSRASLQTKIVQDRLNALIEDEKKDGPSKNVPTVPILIVPPVNIPNSTSNGPIKEAVPSQEPEIPINPKLESQATNQAIKEFSQAINNLEQTQIQLRQKGENDAANSLDQTIIEFKQKSNLNIGGSAEKVHDHHGSTNSNQQNNNQQKSGDLNIGGSVESGNNND